MCTRNSWGREDGDSLQLRDLMGSLTLLFDHKLHYWQNQVLNHLAGMVVYAGSHFRPPPRPCLSENILFFPETKNRKKSLFSLWFIKETVWKSYAIFPMTWSAWIYLMVLLHYQQVIKKKQNFFGVCSLM